MRNGESSTEEITVDRVASKTPIKFGFDRCFGGSAIHRVTTCGCRHSAIRPTLRAILVEIITVNLG